MSRPIGVDLFCGVGGMSLGFDRAGFDVISAVDVEPIHIETHHKNFPSCKTLCTDISRLLGNQLREEASIGDKQIDVVFAGPPCQGFSLIGKRRAEDPRNFLLRDLARLIIELAPRYFVMENVAGLMMGHARNALDDFVRTLEVAQYSIIKPIQVLNAADFNVPQRRRRVFVLGHKNGTTAPIYPKSVQDAGETSRRPTVWDAIGDLPRIARYGYLLESDAFFGELGLASDYAKILRGEKPDPDCGCLEPRANGDGLSGCLRTVHTTKTVRRFKNTEQGSTEEISRFYRLSKNGTAPTLRAGTGPKQGSFMAPRPIHPFQNRCITVREAARLHSFPDWFQFHTTKWHAFRQIGNSVPPRLANAIAGSIARAIETTDHT